MTDILILGYSYSILESFSITVILKARKSLKPSFDLGKTKNLPEADLWMNFMLALADLSNEGINQATDTIPALVVLNRGDPRCLKQLLGIGMLAPLVHPTLVILNKTGGLAHLLQKTLLHLFGKIMRLRENISFADHVLLFGKEHFHSVKLEVEKMTKTNVTFENFLRQLDFVTIDDFELDELRLFVRVVFSKFFVVQSDTESCFKNLLMKCIFPPDPVGQLTIDDCRWRLVNYSLRINQLHVAESALKRAMVDNALEKWMSEQNIFEKFVHEAFKRNETDFMKNLLHNLPRNFLTDTFLDSPDFVTYAIEWIQNIDKHGNLFSVFKKSGIAQLKSKHNSAKNEKKLLELIKNTLEKYNIDLFEVPLSDFSVISIRSIFVIAILTGRLELADLLVIHGTGVVSILNFGKEIN